MPKSATATNGASHRHEKLISAGFKQEQAKGIVEFVQEYAYSPISALQDFALKSDVQELASKVELLIKSIQFIDSKTDIQRSEMLIHFKHLMHWMLGSFALIFAGLGYLIFGL